MELVITETGLGIEVRGPGPILNKKVYARMLGYDLIKVDKFGVVKASKSKPYRNGNIRYNAEEDGIEVYGPGGWVSFTGWEAEN